MFLFNRHTVFGRLWWLGISQVCHSPFHLVKFWSGLTMTSWYKGWPRHFSRCLKRFSLLQGEKRRGYPLPRKSKYLRSANFPTNLYKWRPTFSSCCHSQIWGAIGFSIVEIDSPVYSGHLDTFLAKIGQVSEICQPFENIHFFTIFPILCKISKSRQLENRFLGFNRLYCHDAKVKPR